MSVRKCPVHGVELEYVGRYLMECHVEGCTHSEYSPIQSKVKTTNKMPFWAIN